MSSAVGLNLLPPPRSASNTGVSSPPAAQHASTTKTSLATSDDSIVKDQRISSPSSSCSTSQSNAVVKSNINNVRNSVEMENSLKMSSLEEDESDANHNSEHCEGKIVILLDKFIHTVSSSKGTAK